MFVSFENKGNLFVPEGSVIEWEVVTENTSKLFMGFEKEAKIKAEKKEKNGENKEIIGEVDLLNIQRKWS